MRYRNRAATRAFALYEVLIGMAIFVIGVVALGGSVQNCINATALGAEEDRVRMVLASRMAEIQVSTGVPDASKEFTIETGYGSVKLVQKVAPADLAEEKETPLTGIHRVQLTAEWSRGGVPQVRQLEFYVYRAG